METRPGWAARLRKRLERPLAQRARTNFWDTAAQRGTLKETVYGSPIEPVVGFSRHDPWEAVLKAAAWVVVAIGVVLVAWAYYLK